jgi:chromosome segregation ATPase
VNEVIHAQITELNGQIQMLNNKKTTFKSSADYLTQTRNELIAFRDEINKEIKDLTLTSKTLNDLGCRLRNGEESINRQISNSDLKLKSHQEQDQKLIDEAQGQLDAILKRN